MRRSCYPWSHRSFYNEKESRRTLDLLGDNSPLLGLNISHSYTMSGHIGKGREEDCASQPMQWIAGLPHCFTIPIFLHADVTAPHLCGVVPTKFRALRLGIRR